MKYTYEPEPLCETCRYLSGMECHRNPPIIILRYNSDDTEILPPPGFWPGVGDDDWCGHHKLSEFAAETIKDKLEALRAHEWFPAGVEFLSEDGIDDVLDVVFKGKKLNPYVSCTDVSKMFIADGRWVETERGYEPKSQKWKGTF